MTCCACPGEGVISLTVVLDSENLAVLEKQHGVILRMREMEVCDERCGRERNQKSSSKKNPNGINKLEIA